MAYPPPSEPARPLLLFDHDGVIADSLDVFVPAIIEGCAQAGVPGVRSRADVLRLYEGNVYESLGELGASPEAIEHVMSWANRVAERALPSQETYPGMPQLLARLVGHRRVVIVSSNAGASIRSFLARIDVTGVEVAGAEAGHSKIQKVGLLRAQHPDQGQVWFVSDTAGDMREARAAGVMPVGVSWGWHPPELLLEAGAERLATSPQDLLGIVAPELVTA